MGCRVYLPLPLMYTSLHTSLHSEQCYTPPCTSAGQGGRAELGHDLHTPKVDRSWSSPGSLWLDLSQLDKSQLSLGWTYLSSLWLDRSQLSLAGHISALSCWTYLSSFSLDRSQIFPAGQISAGLIHPLSSTLLPLEGDCLTFSVWIIL